MLRHVLALYVLTI